MLEQQINEQQIRNQKASSFNAKKLLKMIGNIISYLLIGIMGVFIVFVLIFLIQNRGSNVPMSIFNHRLFIVHSGSMSPTFDAGSLILTRTIDPEEIKENDIITYKAISDKVATTHRVVEIIPKPNLQFITRGDANQIDDAEPVTPDEILGKVVIYIPYAGYVLSFARTRKGMAIIILIPGLIILISQMIQLLKLMKENKESSAQE
jgi:signal peptidase